LKRIILCISLLAVASLAALAAPAPIPAQIVGLNKYVDLNGLLDPLNQGIGISGASGGRFVGVIKESSSSSTGYETSFWCVDSQLHAGGYETGRANLHLLSELPDPAARYGTISGPANKGNFPGWTNNLGNAYDSAQVRYAMAAWLITQYTPDETNVANNKSNGNIQQAIWAIMHNTTPGADGSGWSGLSESSSQSAGKTIMEWINLAKANYTSIDLTQWAVVSWALKSGSSDLDGKKDFQTFLVQVMPTPVPEPGFYGAMMLGLGGLFLVYRRRRSIRSPESLA
jgi:hypothetical protein